jgi:hypothetical protein
LIAAMRRPPESPSHADLCVLARAWLKRPASRFGPGCIAAFSETGPIGSVELADAVGWTGLIAKTPAASTVVEVKVSRADFLADRNKSFRQNPSEGIGDFRYYLVPRGLVQDADLPPKWGLIEYTARGLAVVRGHVLERLEPDADGRFHRHTDRWRFEKNARAEIAFLARMLQRVGDAESAHARIAAAERRASSLERMLATKIERIKKLEGEALARALSALATQ